MLPRKCKCGCFVADHLKRCPKCNKKMKPRNVGDDKAEKAANDAERLEKLNQRAKVLDARKLRWVIPKTAQRTIAAQVDRLRLRFKAGDKTVRDELRLAKEAARLRRDGRWSWEYSPPRRNEKGETVMTRGMRTTILVSPKGNRYVQAHPNEYADLILDYGSTDKSGWLFSGGPFRMRLRRYEKSSVAKSNKKQAREEKAHRQAMKERKKAKKKKRMERKKLKKHIAA